MKLPFLLFSLCLFMACHAQERCEYKGEPCVEDYFADKYYTIQGKHLQRPQFKGGYAAFIRRAWSQICLPQEMADTLEKPVRIFCSFVITKTGEVKMRRLFHERNELTEQVGNFLLSLPDFKPARINQQAVDTQVNLAFIFTKETRSLDKEGWIIPIFPCNTPNPDSLIPEKFRGEIFFDDLIL